MIEIVIGLSLSTLFILTVILMASFRNGSYSQRNPRLLYTKGGRASRTSADLGKLTLGKTKTTRSKKVSR